MLFSNWTRMCHVLCVEPQVLPWVLLKELSPHRVFRFPSLPTTQRGLCGGESEEC